MSYQFDARDLRVQSQAKLNRETASTRLLARRTARQERRATRAI